MNRASSGLERRPPDRETAVMRPALRTLAGLLLAATSIAAEPCRIEIVERGDGRPVPGVELRTTHGVRLVSYDSLMAYIRSTGEPGPKK